jgi:hypothetical protein
MPFLNKESIRAASDLKHEVVAVPEWGGDIRVRGMTGSERDAFEASYFTGTDKDRKMNLDNIRARLVVLCCVDEHGDRIFENADLGWLGNKSGSALARVYEVCQRLSGLTNGDVKALEKNSESGQEGFTTSP